MNFSHILLYRRYSSPLILSHYLHITRSAAVGAAAQQSYCVLHSTTSNSSVTDLNNITWDNSVCSSNTSYTYIHHPPGSVFSQRIQSISLGIASCPQATMQESKNTRAPLAIQQEQANLPDTGLSFGLSIETNALIPAHASGFESFAQENRLLYDKTNSTISPEVRQPIIRMGTRPFFNSPPGAKLPENIAPKLSERDNTGAFAEALHNNLEEDAKMPLNSYKDVSFLKKLSTLTENNPSNHDQLHNNQDQFLSKQNYLAPQTPLSYVCHDDLNTPTCNGFTNGNTLKPSFLFGTATTVKKANKKSTGPKTGGLEFGGINNTPAAATTGRFSFDSDAPSSVSSGFGGGPKVEDSAHNNSAQAESNTVCDSY